jgi:hypothetical protein
MDWRCGSSGRAPALQMKNPEFIPKFHQEKRKERKRKKESVTLKTGI